MPGRAVIGDFNGDGRPDVAVNSMDLPRVLFLRNTSSAPVSVPPAPVVASLAITAWPNPARTHARLSLRLVPGRTAHVELFDLTGRQLAEQRFHATPAGRHEWQLDDLGRLAPGVYPVRVRQGNDAAFAKLLIVR